MQASAESAGQEIEDYQEVQNAAKQTGPASQLFRRMDIERRRPSLVE